jgi:hypothetical protein
MRCSLLHEAKCSSNRPLSFTSERVCRSLQTTHELTHSHGQNLFTSNHNPLIDGHTHATPDKLGARNRNDTNGLRVQALEVSVRNLAEHEQKRRY